MDFLSPAEKYLNKIGSNFITAFRSKDEIKYILTPEMIGTRYLIVHSTYDDDGDFMYTISVAVFKNIGENYNPGNKVFNFNFNYEETLFTTFTDNEPIYNFTYTINEGNMAYSLYTHVSKHNISYIM